MGKADVHRPCVLRIAGGVCAAVTCITGMRIVLERTAKSSAGWHASSIALSSIMSARPIEPGEVA